MNDLKLISFEFQYMKDVVSCWNESAEYDAITEERFLQEVVMDENFDKNLAPIALVGEKVVGFCLGIKRKYPYLTRGLEEYKGWISIMFVHPEYQNRGIGQELLDRVEEQLKNLGTKEITLCAYSPNYFTPGIDLNYKAALHFFDKNGYTHGKEAVSMNRDISAYILPEATKIRVAELKKEGIIFKYFSMEYMDRLLELTEKEFGGGWVRNIRMAIQSGTAEDTILIAVDGDDNILGYCMRKIDGCDARFGPIGIRKDLRSKGLGGILFDLQMLEMKKHKIYNAFFLWTSGDAIRFYERHGMKIYRTYLEYRKEL